MEKARYGSVSYSKLVKFTTDTASWIKRQNNANEALRKLILHQIQVEKKGLNLNRTGYPNGFVKEATEKYRSNTNQCSGCGSLGFPLLALGSCLLCSDCSYRLYSFLGRSGLKRNFIRPVTVFSDF